MAKEKYIVMTHNNIFYSNSRNARKHLAEHITDYVEVYKNNDTGELLCRAERYRDMVLVGTVKRG